MIQLTVSNKHDLLLQYLVGVMKVLVTDVELVIEKIDVVVVVPNGAQSGFKLGTVTSEKSPMILAVHWKKDDVRVGGYVRVSRYGD